MSTRAPLAECYWSERDSNPARLPLLGAQAAGAGNVVRGSTIRITPPTVDGEYYVRLRVVDEYGEEDCATTSFAVVEGRPRIPDHDVEAPRWIRDALVYGVLPARFGEPPLKSTIARLDYLSDLGVNTLWIAPATATIPRHAGYDVVDYFSIREDYGTEEDFRELVVQAHSRGMRVLMDVVPNHTSELHRYYQDALGRGRRSVHWHLYHRDRSGNATHYFDWVHLPNLDFGNPEVRTFVTEALSFWIREYDVDGYRVDAAWGIKERGPDFWPQLRRELKRIKPDVFLLAEASARDPYYAGNGFDAAYDWNHDLGHWAWEDVWVSPDGLVERLHAALTNNGSGYPAGSLVFRFLNNNDTGERFVVRHGPGLTRVAAALMVTVPGIPGAYTGDEIGADYHPYAGTQPLGWDDDPFRLRAYYTGLFRLRQELQNLRTGGFARLEAEPQDKVYAYLRWSDDAVPVAVVLNWHDEPVRANVTLPSRFPPGTEVTDRLHGGRFTASDGVLMVDLPAYTARILSP
nr:alpha-amylase family glycosyl hydrolase [Phytoactinopolyspora alkaliphila]